MFPLPHTHLSIPQLYRTHAIHWERSGVRRGRHSAGRPELEGPSAKKEFSTRAETFLKWPLASERLCFGSPWRGPWEEGSWGGRDEKCGEGCHFHAVCYPSAEPPGTYFRTCLLAQKGAGLTFTEIRSTYSASTTARMMKRRMLIQTSAFNTQGKKSRGFFFSCLKAKTPNWNQSFREC